MVLEASEVKIRSDTDIIVPATTGDTTETTAVLAVAPLLPNKCAPFVKTRKDAVGVTVALPLLSTMAVTVGRVRVRIGSLNEDPFIASHTNPLVEVLDVKVAEIDTSVAVTTSGSLVTAWSRNTPMLGEAEEELEIEIVVEETNTDPTAVDPEMLQNEVPCRTIKHELTVSMDELFIPPSRANAPLVAEVTEIAARVIVVPVRVPTIWTVLRYEYKG